MKTRTFAGMSLLLAGLMVIAGAARAVDAVASNELSGASITSNVPARAGEASTMTNGVPNLLTSNVQPGELGIQSRLTVRRAAIAYGGDPGLRMMGASGPMRPVLIDPPAPTQ